MSVESAVLGGEPENRAMSGGLTLRLEMFPVDLDRFVDFYTRVLRFELATDRRADSEPYVELKRGATSIGALLAWHTVDRALRNVPQGIEVVLEVTDLPGERDAIVAAGWELAEDITMRPWGLEDFRLFDPEGHYLRFTTRLSEIA